MIYFTLFCPAKLSNSSAYAQAPCSLCIRWGRALGPGYSCTQSGLMLQHRDPIGLLFYRGRVTLGTRHPWSTDPRALCPIPGDLVSVSSQGKLNLGAALFSARENILAGLSPWLYDFIVRKWKCQGSTPGCSLGSPPCLHS